MEMEAKGSSETLMAVHQATRHHFSEHRNSALFIETCRNDLWHNQGAATQNKVKT
jgi:hypothetical protein